MKKLMAFCAAAAVAAAFCLPAECQETKAKVQPKAKNLIQNSDADKDGKATFEEVSAAFPAITREKFDRLDRDKSGALTAEDLPTPGMQGAQMLQGADADKDGKVTLEEVKAAFPQMSEEQFKHFDTNGDGAVTKEDKPPVRPEKPQMDVQARMKAVEERWAKSDANGDGKVSKEEFMATPGTNAAAFQRHDRNGDGVLSRDDLRPPVPPSGPRRFDAAQVDKNGDGKFSYEEATEFFPRLLREAFDRLDVNKDGFVAMDEIAKPKA